MAVYRVLGEHVISEAELRGRADELVRLEEKAAMSLPALIEFSEDRAFLAEVAPADFPPIGKNLPLTVMLRDVYTGKYPKESILGSRKDVAIVSGVKNYDVFNATARALNFVAKGAKAKNHARMPDAFSDGTRLIAHSPAVLTDEIVLTVEFAVDSFPGELFEHIASAFGKLAGIPILLPYAGFLLGASQVVKLAGGLGDALFDGRPAFSITRSLAYDLPGTPPVSAGFRILCNDTFDASKYKYVDGTGLVDAGGAPYKGDEPYVVVSLDGKVRENLASFAPTVASAAILQRFFQIKDRAEVAIDTIVDGIKLVSDMHYRKRAEDLKERIEATPAGPERDRLKAELDAVLKNIGNDVLKPKP